MSAQYTASAAMLHATITICLYIYNVQLHTSGAKEQWQVRVRYIEGHQYKEECTHRLMPSIFLIFVYLFTWPGNNFLSPQHRAGGSRQGC